MENKYDVVIIGGGIAGLALANSLKDTILKVALLERKPQYIDVNRGDTLYPHSIDILDKWNILDILLSKGAVKSTNISLYLNDKDDKINIDIISPERHKNSFLLSLNHELIEKSLYEGLEKHDNVKIILGANVYEITQDESQNNYTSVKYKEAGIDKQIFADAFIAADGRDSLLRKNANINYNMIDFNHDIVILNNSTPPKNYSNNSSFLYGKNHPIIIGPLPENKTRLSVILTKDATYKWMSMSEQDLTKAISEESEILRDSVIQKSEKHLYEIKMCLADKFNDKNLFFVGDSAHTVHPISGQGMALAISDADFLSEVINKHIHIGDLTNAFTEYGNNRRQQVQKLQEEVANFGNVLIDENKVVNLARMFLLSSIETNQMFERQIEAMLQSEIEKF